MSAILVKSFVGQAERYNKKELTHKRETYYSDESARFGQWTGKGAKTLGLRGNTSFEDFSRISRGIDPRTGERFRRMTLGKTRETNGELKRVKEIAGWDMVISAPKSVSIAALIGGDERVRAAHNDAVTDALERAERQAQANLGGGKKEQTGNLIVARFKHDSARPSKDGFVAPQLHDHCFIMNATLRADGTLKPLEGLELHRAQSYIRSVYYTGLADRLQKLGYAIEIDRKTGAPEITGISKEYRAACSPRRAQILELAKEAGKNFRQLGLVSRREKVFDRDLIQEQHEAIDGLFDYQAQRVVQKARKTAPTIKPDAAKESVAFALAKLSKRESVFNPRVVLLEANKHGVGRTSVAAIEAELETRRKDGRIKTIRLRDGREAVFLASDAQIETELLNHIKAVQPTDALHNEILKAEIPDGVKETDEIEFRKLSYEQQRAVKQILRAKTGVVTLEEGRAGAGGTATLSFVNKMAERTGYEVLGLAPATGAAQQLGNAEITSSTLQKLLASSNSPRSRKRFFIVDESSFVSSRQMDKFFRDAVKPNDRVLLVGNTRRHEGIEARQSSANIEREELADGAKVGTVRRRTKKSDREAVEQLSEEKIIEAVTEMRGRGQIREIKDRDERHNVIVEAFITEPERSLVVAPRSTDRQEINRKIHTALKDAGKIGKEETEIKILRPRSKLSGVEREFAGAYREGDVITYTRGSAENNIAAKSLATVVKADRQQNLLTVEIKDGTDGKEAREVTYNPKRLRGVSVWTEEKIKVSTGDRLQLRAPFEEKKTKIADDTMLKVGKITPQAVTLTTDKGKAVKLDTSKPQAIDYGYAVTSHSSQGKTIDRVLIHAEMTESKQILSERMARVAVSRARDEALIFTDDAERFARKMARQIEKAEITQTKAETVEHAPERAEKIVLDTKPEVEKVESSEIRQPIISPEAPILQTPEIKSPLPQQKTADGASDAKIQREILIEEVLRMSRESLSKQGVEPNAEAWTRYADDIGRNAPNEKAPISQTSHLKWAQRSVPELGRINLEKASRLEATHLILKSSSEVFQKQFVENKLKKYERQIAAERGEIKPPVVLPTVEESATPEVKTQPAQEKPFAADVKTELAPVEREEIKSPVFSSAAEKSAKPEIKIETPPEKTTVSDAQPELAKAEQKETEQLRQPAAAKLPTPTIEIEPAQQESISLDAIPEAARVKREEIEIQPARKETVVLDAKPEVERGEVEPPVMLSEAPTLPTAEIKAQPPMPQTTGGAGDAKYSRETLIKEVLQISRDSLTKQGINPDPQAWKPLANAVINDAPNQRLTNNQGRILRDLEKNAPPSERVGLAGKTRLEATHAILKAAPENRRDEIVKTTLARYEKEVAAERADVVAKPEIKPEVKAERGDAVKPEINNVAEPEIREAVKTTQIETVAVAEIKPALKVRDFAGVGREELISELVAHARAEARDWTGKDLSYSQEKQLTKMYRQFGDIPPLEEQTSYLNTLQEHFSEPLPPPKNFIEATVLTLDNITDAEKSASLRGQMTKIDEIIKREESQNTEPEKALEQSGKEDAFGRTDSYFTQELHRAKMQPDRKSYFELTNEAQQRGFIQMQFAATERAQEQQTQQALYQLGIADALKNQIAKNFNEQGIKLEPLAQRIISQSVDVWANQKPTAEDYKNVEDINRSRGGGITPQTKLEARAYVLAQSDERKRDKIGLTLAAEASEAAAETEQQQQTLRIKAEREMNQENTNDYPIRARTQSLKLRR